LEDNFKGQQYYSHSNSGFLEGSVINYSEILGSNLHLRANGVFKPSPVKEKEDEKGWFSSWFSTKSITNDALRTCPDDFMVKVTGASIRLGGVLSIDIPIQGESILRVLYADPRLRIFVSPRASESFAGEWENVGLVVVQVRSDLVNKGRAIDLRDGS
jgi:hypothetical protein